MVCATYMCFKGVIKNNVYANMWEEVLSWFSAIYSQYHKSNHMHVQAYLGNQSLQDFFLLLDVRRRHNSPTINITSHKEALVHPSLSFSWHFRFRHILPTVEQRVFICLTDISSMHRTSWVSCSLQNVFLRNWSFSVFPSSFEVGAKTASSRPSANQ